MTPEGVVNGAALFRETVVVKIQDRDCLCLSIFTNFSVDVTVF